MQFRDEFNWNINLSTDKCNNTNLVLRNKMILQLIIHTEPFNLRSDFYAQGL